MTEFAIGVDVGGTFTDACAISLDDGVVYTGKARSTPKNLVDGLLASLELVAQDAGMGLGDLLGRTVMLAHGTTITSNVMLTWRGAHAGLLTTRGFADELLIMRARGRVAGISLSERRHLRATSKPPQIIPRARIAELSERIDHHGSVLVPLDESEVVAAVERLLASGVDSLAVALLWSPENPVHELAVERIVRERWPDLHVSLSHRLASVLGEYERTATAVINAWVAPSVERYLDHLTSTLAARGLGCPVLVVQAAGGVLQAEDTVPIHTVESGPAAGMVAVRALAEAVGERRIIATDVGGTTFKVGLLSDGNWATASETIVNQYPILMPMVDLISIGSGGGSIAWVDDTRLRVGPESAGADPGPVCYGWGGSQPTVTDADLVLGFINPEQFLDGRLRLNVSAAKEAIRDRVAQYLFGGDVVQAAAGIRRVVDAQMADLIRKATLERGLDPRGFSLVAYGGAGPLHAADYARGLGIAKVLVPDSATVYSAFGAARSDIVTTLQSSVRPQLLDSAEELSRTFSKLEESARLLIGRQRISHDTVRISRWVDMKYESQLHDVRVVIGDRPPTKASLREAFEARYEVLYGSNARLTSAGVRLLRVGIDALAPIRRPPEHKRKMTRRGADTTGRRRVFWPQVGNWVETDIYAKAQLTPGARLLGPAMIEQRGTSVAVPPGATAAIDHAGNTVIEFDRA
jgi:N-methylhydantoinase A